MFLIKTMHNKKRRRNFLTSPLIFYSVFRVVAKVDMPHIVWLDIYLALPSGNAYRVAHQRNISN